MLKPDFLDADAELLWDAYFVRVDRILRKAGGKAIELSNELRQHLMDSFDGQPPHRTEAERLQAAIARLGIPESYLRPILADSMLEQGAQSYDPVLIGEGLYHAILSGSRYAVKAMLFALGYVTMAIFAAMALLKPFWSDHVGLAVDPAAGMRFGILRQPMGPADVLGWWVIPISLLVIAVLYVVLTRGLRTMRPAG